MKISKERLIIAKKKSISVEECSKFGTKYLDTKVLDSVVTRFIKRALNE